ncbi:DUF721 domain-containing protein [Puniceicoccaceae bacterium K14]|nr:DUF721 domain-containing protein [Puniceicoccaceae bacterium K14]
MAGKPHKFSRKVENLIANFRGIPENYKPEAKSREKGIDSIIDRIERKYKIGIESVEDLINENWTQIVGAANARSCSPSRIERENTLIVSVANPILRQELQFNKAILLKNLHKISGTRKIRYLVFKTG